MSEGAAGYPPVETTNQLAKRRTELATQRTALADDRTLMAWIRTSLSMISFGFTIYKFMQELAKLENSRLSDNGPRNFGLALVGLGTVALIIATFQYWSRRRELQRNDPSKGRLSLVLLVAFAISLLGILVFLSMVLRAGPF